MSLLLLLLPWRGKIFLSTSLLLLKSTRKDLTKYLLQLQTHNLTSQNVFTMHRLPLSQLRSLKAMILNLLRLDYLPPLMELGKNIALLSLVHYSCGKTVNCMEIRWSPLMMFPKPLTTNPLCGIQIFNLRVLSTAWCWSWHQLIQQMHKKKW